MRTITLIVIHCSAVRPNQTSSAAQIDTWHRQRGFHLGIGYHYVVRRNGQIEPGRPDWMVGAHCLNHNAHSIGVCYEGGCDIRGQPADTRTEAQKKALRRLLEKLHRAYPKAIIVGHHDLNPHKDCPCIENVACEYADLQPEFQVRGCARHILFPVCHRFKDYYSPFHLCAYSNPVPNPPNSGVLPMF